MSIRRKHATATIEGPPWLPKMRMWWPDCLSSEQIQDQPMHNRTSSPLFGAVQKSNFELVTLLLRAGADVYSRSMYTKQTALQIASRRADSKMVGLILRHISTAIESIASIELVSSVLLTAAKSKFCSEEVGATVGHRTNKRKGYR